MSTSLPERFLWGTATAAHQVEGNEERARSETLAQRQMYAGVSVRCRPHT
jgi:beta-glucosidase/6-phospho-beta-glucosidase/beta-galactosidase